MQKGAANQNTNPAASLFSTFTSFIKTDQQQQQPRNLTPLPNLQGGSGNSGDFFIRMSLDLLQNSKELRRNEPIKAAISAALGAILSLAFLTANTSLTHPYL